MPLITTPPGYRQEPMHRGRINDSKLYIGIVKANTDVQRMGRLQVWIPELTAGLGSDEANPAENERHWYTVSYASPFAGATNWRRNKDSTNSMDDSQQSYGFWMVPPDLNNEVLVAFINGEPSRGVWFACLYQQYMNHQTPGIPVNEPLDSSDKKCGALPPVVEYNRADPKAVPPDPHRPTFTPLADALCEQGLMADPQRGQSNSGARREAPSRVFGIKTPRGQHFVMDDDVTNEHIRIRTRSGVQVLINDTTGFVYINSKRGNSWIEISDDGVDIYSSKSVSLRAGGDFNVRADGDINLDAGQSVNVRSTTGDTLLMSGGEISLGAAGVRGIKMETGSGGIDLKSTLGITAESKLGIDLHAVTTLKQSAGVAIQSQAGTRITALTPLHVRQGSIQDNGVVAPFVFLPASSVASKEPKPLADTAFADDGKDCCKTHTTKKTIVSRMPAHEPWKETARPRGVDLPPPSPSKEKFDVIIPGAITNRPSLFKTTPGQGTVATPSTRTVVTGSGTSRIVPQTDFKTVSLANVKVRDDVLSSIREASGKTKLPFGFLMVLAETESSLNPNAKARTSSASGLFQFTDGTAKEMAAKYGSKYGFTAADKNDPQVSALMGGLYAAENAARLQQTLGREPSGTDLYMAHFLGAGGATRFLQADPDMPAFRAVSADQAAANRAVFYNRDGSPRSVQEVYNTFQNKIEPRSKAFENAYNQLPNATDA